MSNKIQLQTNNTALDGYIARINAAKEVAASLPDAGTTEDLDAVITELEIKTATLNTTLEGKASGGGVETCAVEVTNAISVFYTGIENGVITAKSLTNDYITSFSITDCVCNSLLTIYENNVSLSQVINTKNAQLLYQGQESEVFKITAASGQTATIYLEWNASSGGSTN